jgi:hypothetical protein
VTETPKGAVDVHRFSDDLRAEFPDQGLDEFERQITAWQDLFNAPKGWRATRRPAYKRLGS